ncbi:DUF134 domain-containing protein [Clostridium sp. AF19-22AC]|jgi:predicted DNA-binding protein (UPF0251 family)|uniref:UPF0251 protein A8806_10217 n=1 Tax=Faecalicatena orotica TaxID=1544 RepID=A0A2Y9C9M5_9FIRM|nr:MULTISPECIES: DUF134 domain-containing protein [Clostridia]PWJ31161.1 putative DNA-binding protein (UPF0251 family) [Faecalicatena orotica]RHR30814.1 DUF134 domain-containing protein [Clostridium sp. AF19-22AC]SSA54366.1 Predicted DNA-binding protein, UPF0251 family [Faecalicatena orotica]
MPRPQKCRCICSRPKVKGFTPVGHESGETVIIGYDEYEAVRLLDYVKLTQEQCAKKMNISRPTVTRIYEEVRQKIADAMVNGKEIRIEGGDVIVCEAMKPECVNEVHCCHRQK